MLYCHINFCLCYSLWNTQSIRGNRKVDVQSLFSMTHSSGNPKIQISIYFKFFGLSLIKLLVKFCLWMNHAIQRIIWIHLFLCFTKYMLKMLSMFNNLWVSRFYFFLLLPFVFAKTTKTKKVLNKRRRVLCLQYFRNSCWFLYIYLPRMNVSICGSKRHSGKPANIWYTTNLLMLGIKMWRRELYGKQRKNTFVVFQIKKMWLFQIVLLSCN